MPRRPAYFKPDYSRPSPLISTPKPGRLGAYAERHKFYNSPAWRKLRAVFLADNPLCVDCLAEGNPIAATVPHHVIERLDQPDLALDEGNLIPLCNSHHTKRHNLNRG